MTWFRSMKRGRTCSRMCSWSIPFAYGVHSPPGKDSRFLHYGSEAEARFNVSLTRAKAVLAPPSATGPLGMLQTASARLFGRLDMASLQKSAEPLLHCLVCALALRIWMSLLGTVPITSAMRPWKELPLALSLKMRDSSLDGLGPKTSRDLSAIRKSEAMWSCPSRCLTTNSCSRPHGCLPCRFCMGDRQCNVVTLLSGRFLVSCFSGRPRPGAWG